MKVFNWSLVKRRLQTIGVLGALAVGLVVSSQHPLPLSFEATTDSVSLEWDAVPGASTYHVVAREGTGVGRVLSVASIQETKFKLNGLSPNEEILVTVSAEGNFNSVVSTTKAIKTANTDIGTPSNLRTLDIGSTEIEVAWSAVENAVGYNATISSIGEFSDSNTNLTTEFQLDPADRTIKFEGLLPNQVYTVHLSALDADGEGKPAILPVKTREANDVDFSSMRVAARAPFDSLGEEARYVVSNHPPQVRKPLREIALTSDQPLTELDLDEYFEDPENGPLIYTAYPSDPDIVSASGDERLALNAESEGRTVVHVTATDLRGESTSQYIAITVQDFKGSEEVDPRPLLRDMDGLLLSSRTPLVSKDTPLVIGNTRNRSSETESLIAQNLSKPLTNLPENKELGIGSQLWRASHLASNQRSGTENLNHDAGVELQQFNVSGRHSFTEFGNVALAVHSDYSAATVAPAQEASGNTITQPFVSRLRAGLESSFTAQLGQLGQISPYTSVNLRQDMGILDQGTGVEVAGGVRLTNDRLSLEAQGRALAMHSVDTVEENRFSVRASLNPAQDGTGFSMAIEPSWGRYETLQSTEGGQDSRFLARRITPYTPQITAINEFNVNTRIGYGIRLPQKGFVLTPFLDADLSDVYQQTKLVGIRLDRLGDTVLPFSLDMAVGIMERDTESDEVANMRLSLSF
ncbi:MAG: fibronectin type III domain-containing protein [Gammaproteobacteria bacterium]|nr:fibronectin type III domain-containing protein [Gammaproteobacteria bacterium]